MTAKYTIESLIGTQFSYTTVEMLESQPRRARRSNLEDRTYTVVGYKPQYKNTVLVEDVNGTVLLAKSVR